MAARVAVVVPVVARRRVSAARAVMPAPVVPVVREPMVRPARSMVVPVVAAVLRVQSVMAG
jgi:hypothetical protein